MSNPVFLHIYSNGDIWVSPEIEFTPGSNPTNASSGKRVAEAGTLVKVFQFNATCSPQKITTLTGSGNSSASALAASGGATTKSYSSLVELT